MARIEFEVKQISNVPAEYDSKGHVRTVQFSTKREDGVKVTFTVSGPTEAVNKCFEAWPLKVGSKFKTVLSTKFVQTAITQAAKGAKKEDSAPDEADPLTEIASDVNGLATES